MPDIGNPFGFDVATVLTGSGLTLLVSAGIMRYGSRFKFTAAELREYAAGEPASNIDWNATARLASPYVREFEAESDRTTLFVVDARSSLGGGPPGGTTMEYLRTVALSHVTAAQRLGDPVGCFAVDDHGVRRLTTPTNATRGYEIARRRLRGLTDADGPTRPVSPRPSTAAQRGTTPTPGSARFSAPAPRRGRPLTRRRIPCRPPSGRPSPARRGRSGSSSTPTTRTAPASGRS